MKTSPTQLAAVAGHLRAGHSITPMDALNMYGCFRLAAVVLNLKRPPYNMNIVTTMVTASNGKRFASYRLRQ